VDAVSRIEAVLTLLGRPEGLPILLMVAAISALAVASLRASPAPAPDEPEG
jgi:hypothetical protein